MKTQLFINKFQKGSNENANLGIGNLVGIDTYTKKGVAILAKKSTLITAGFVREPHFIITSGGGAYIWAQCADGSVIYSSDGGSTWTDTAFPAGVGHGNGLIYFQGYVFAFGDSTLYYHNASPGTGAWTLWQSELTNFTMNPISGLHFPFFYPNARGVYFGNGTFTTNGDATVGFFGQVGTTTFNPAGVAGTGYLYNGAILKLSSLTYAIGSIDFLPPTNIAISAVNFQNPSQGSDLITWDTVSANKFNPPLHIYSNSLAVNSAVATAGIKQIFNRNQVLYAVTGGNHTIYETNGSSFNLLEDIGLYSNLRSSDGQERDLPVYFNSYPQAICVVGNKLLTGVATITNMSSYPPSSLVTTGLFPIGVWSVAFSKDGSHTTQCEFILPLGNSNVSPAGNNNYSKITSVQSIPQSGGGSSQIAIGFAYNSGTPTYGIALVDLYNYIDDINYTAIESEVFEIGTALTPQTVNNIEINLVKNLLMGQTIDISYRTNQGQPWTIIDTYTGDGTLNYYALTKNPIGATQFIQLRIRMATGSPNQIYSPQLRTVILS